MSELEIAVKAVRLYAESHPRPLHVTQKQACEMIGVSYPTLKKLIRAGELKLNKCGLIPISEVDKLIS